MQMYVGITDFNWFQFLKEKTRQKFSILAVWRKEGIMLENS